MVEKVRVAVSSAGGYGFYYLRALLDNYADNQVFVVSVFDPIITKLPIYAELQKLNIPCYSEYSLFVDSLSEADLVVIASPIEFHAQQSIDALRQNCNILLEKPVAGNLQQAELIQKELSNSKNWLIVGYQWTYSDAILKLKKDLIQGRHGKILKAKSLVFWPRGYDYFKRNDWAGKKITSRGVPINDSLINNAMAHFIHNLLFLCGKEMNQSAVPTKGKGEFYKAYEIETFDTAVLHIETEENVSIGFYGSHVCKNPKGPLFILECEDSVIYYGELSTDIVAVRNDGHTEVYGDPEACEQFKKLGVAIDLCRGVTRDSCSIDSALQQTKIIDAISEQTSVVKFNSEFVRNLDNDRKYVEGLGYMLLSSYQQGILPTNKNFSIKGSIQTFTI